MELDLVEISPKADPPVAKIMDYKKFVYEQKKREKVMKANASKVVIKEIRFGPNTDDHDYEFKRKHAEKFLKEGAKLKAYVFFKGRSIIYKDQGEILLLRLAQDLEELGKVEQMPKLEGKRMNMFLAPKKKQVDINKNSIFAVLKMRAVFTYYSQQAENARIKKGNYA